MMKTFKEFVIIEGKISNNEMVKRVIEYLKGGININELETYLTNISKDDKKAASNVLLPILKQSPDVKESVLFGLMAGVLAIDLLMSLYMLITGRSSVFDFITYIKKIKSSDKHSVATDLSNLKN
jgi:hypothetical protein